MADATLAAATQTIGTPGAEATEEETKGYAEQSVAKPESVVFYVLPNTTADKTTLTLEGTMTLQMLLQKHSQILITLLKDIIILKLVRMQQLIKVIAIQLVPVYMQMITSKFKRSL